MIEEISATDLNRRRVAGEAIQLIDVRQPDEWNFARIEGAKLIPLGEILNRMGEIDPNRETVIHCKMGGRSDKGDRCASASGFQRRIEEFEKAESQRGRTKSTRKCRNIRLVDS